MVRATKILRHSSKALEDHLLKLLQSEIKHEIPLLPLQNNRNGSLGGFVIDWDSSQSKDVVLQRNCKSGEEVVVSALLSRYRDNISMKVGLKKPSLNSMLLFDCEVYPNGIGGSRFDIRSASFLRSTTLYKPSAYTGPLFSTLDAELQKALKEYLVAKGITEGFTNSLRVHLIDKEQVQYVNWLQILESWMEETE